MSRFPKPLEQLIDQFRKLPGVGPKTAERFALFIGRQSNERVEEFATALLAARAALVLCTTCHGIAERSPCTICADPRREAATLCVVADPQDIHVIERSGAFRGRYHVLGGVLSPIEGVTPEQLKIRELLERVKASAHQGIEEVIIALDPNIEGEATTIYLKRQLAPTGITVTRLARGLPLGADIEYADDITIADAMNGRRIV
ncbi:recombination protein RecR [Candidatus Uhrbacteria bacterium]|nr:recombination protein RecR [Candidatus Uhrbacteria bacterium]